MAEKLTKEEFAANLNGREYGSEITKREERVAKADGLVVVFGYSDDNIELRGAFEDEIGAYDGGKVLIVDGKVISSEHDCECAHCGFEAIKKRAFPIDALWCNEEPYSWTFSTPIPHATFDVMEDGEKFCRGIVFSLAEMFAKPAS